MRDASFDFSLEVAVTQGLLLFHLSCLASEVDVQLPLRHLTVPLNIFT